jgi:hypothetical protein
VGIALESYNGEPEKEGKIVVFVNLSLGKLSDSISDGEISSDGLWITDEFMGTIKSITAQILDVQGQDIVGIRRLISESGNWKIEEDGTITAKRLCLDEVCVDKEQLRALLQNSGINTVYSNSSPQITSPESALGGTTTPVEQGSTGQAPTDDADTEPPVITLNGLNPATLDLNSTYSDMGAVITDSKEQNLGYTTEVWLSSSSADQGYTKLFNDINNNSLNTSTNATYLIKYNATDSAGNHATEVTRTVIVGSGVVAIPAEEPTEQEPPVNEPPAEEESTEQEPPAEEPETTEEVDFVE